MLWETAVRSKKNAVKEECNFPVRLQGDESVA